MTSLFSQLYTDNVKVACMVKEHIRTYYFSQIHLFYFVLPNFCMICGFLGVDILTFSPYEEGWKLWKYDFIVHEKF